MKRILSALLVLVLVLALCPMVFAEEPVTATLTLPTAGITVTEKFKVNASEYVSMSDGSTAPTDLRYSLKNSKYATVNKTTGLISTKKAGSVKLTVKSASTGMSASCTVNVKANVFKEIRSGQQMYDYRRQRYPDLPKYNVFFSAQKIYFKGGKLTVNMRFHNYYGDTLTKLYRLRLGLYDTNDKLITKVSKATITTKHIKPGKYFDYTVTFPKKGLDKIIDLTITDPKDGLLLNYYLGSVGDYTFYFLNKNRDYDPNGSDDDWDSEDMSMALTREKKLPTTTGKVAR